MHAYQFLHTFECMCVHDTEMRAPAYVPLQTAPGDAALACSCRNTFTHGVVLVLKHDDRMGSEGLLLNIITPVKVSDVDAQHSGIKGADTDGCQLPHLLFTCAHALARTECSQADQRHLTGVWPCSCIR